MFDAVIGAHMESFSPGSIVLADLNERLVPLLAHHAVSSPIGRICRAWEEADGLQVEARLVAGDDQLAALERQVDAGITSGLSIGFLPDKGANQ